MKINEHQKKSKKIKANQSRSMEINRNHRTVVSENNRTSKDIDANVNNNQRQLGPDCTRETWTLQTEPASFRQP